MTQRIGVFAMSIEEPAFLPQFVPTANTFMGLIILTFFVGAYTRMILA